MTGTVPLGRSRRLPAGPDSGCGRPAVPLVLGATAIGGLAAWAMLLPLGEVPPLVSALAGAGLGGTVLAAAGRWRTTLRSEPDLSVDPAPRTADAAGRDGAPASGSAEQPPTAVPPTAVPLSPSLPAPLPAPATDTPAADTPSWEDERRAGRIERMDAMGRLAGGIAHDFNNLLGAITGYADFLASDLPQGSPQADYAARILRATERGKEMLRRLTAFARVGSPDLRPTGAARLLAEALAQIGPGLPASVTLTVREEPDLPDLLANGPLLVQALVTLALDACEGLAGRTGAGEGGTGEGGAGEGRLTLRIASWPGPGDLDAICGAAACRADCPQGWTVFEALPPRRRPHVLFEVRDNGPGLPDALLPRLFEPFRPNGKGNGLELAVVLGTVRGHDGGLTVCTREGEGTAFRLFVPILAASARPQSGPADTAPAPPLHRCRILVVDDEPTMGDLMSAGLERFGHETAVCESADEALDVFEEEPGAFDVVIADQSMPGMSGMALIARLKARRPDLVCVLYTGHSRVATDARAWAAGADAFFTKPVDIVEVARRISALAADRRPGAAR